MKYLKLFEQFEEESWWNEDSPFDDLEDDQNFKIGDFVVILNSWSGKLHVGAIGEIKGENFKYAYEVFSKNFIYPTIGWWYEGNDIRKATKEEINGYLK